MILETPLPQTPANQSPNAPVSPAETPSGAAPSGDAPQPMQQQQVSLVINLNITAELIQQKPIST